AEAAPPVKPVPQKPPVEMTEDLRAGFRDHLRHKMNKQMQMQKSKEGLCTYTIHSDGTVDADTGYGNALIGASVNALYASVPSGNEPQVIILPDHHVKLRHAIA